MYSVTRLIDGFFSSRMACPFSRIIRFMMLKLSKTGSGRMRNGPPQSSNLTLIWDVQEKNIYSGGN